MAKSRFGSCLVKRRFKSSLDHKLCSTTEYNNIDSLLDKKNKQKTVFDVENAFSFPQRLARTGLTKEEYIKREADFFNMWKEFHQAKYFERNIEIWRQFWVSVERSECIVQIVDCRCLDLFLNFDVINIYNTKKHIILLNKCDLMNIEPGLIDRRIKNEYVKQSEYNINNDLNYIYYKISQLPGNVVCYFINNQYSVTDILLSSPYKTFAFVGFPNTGKSSTINGIFNSKKVKVSKTPGKTKHLQSLYINDTKIVFDTPGLVFPCDKNILLLFGIINIDTAMNVKKFFDYMIKIIGISALVKHYNLIFCNDSRRTLFENFYESFYNKISCDEGKMIKIIIKDFMDGKFECKKEKDDLKVDYGWFCK